MKIEVIRIEDLKPLEKNVRKHNEKQIKELTRSFEQFGQTRAIIVDEDNNILIGNGLYIAMKNHGEATAECSRVTGLTENQKKKLVLTDNKVFSLGMDDYENISAFINEITFDGDFDIAGFDDEVLREMTREVEQINKDVANYGTIPENYVQPVNNVQTSAVQGTPVAQNSPVATSPSYTPSPTTPVAEVKNNRTIICPSCGEVIHLD